MRVNLPDRRRTLPRRRLLLLVPGALALAACGRRDSSASQRPRCAFCGMRIPAGSHWEAGAVGSNGGALAFDTPACLFRLRLSPRGQGMRGEWVTEYYGPAGRRTDARAVRYVPGSDVIGPMGPDLIPVDPARTEVFVRDHHGREAIAFDAITPQTLSSL